MGVVRASQPLAVRDPEIEGRMANIDPSVVYDSNHPLVRAYPWAFNDVTADEQVESATRSPGEKRGRVRGRPAQGAEEQPGQSPPDKKGGPLTSKDNPKA